MASQWNNGSRIVKTEAYKDRYVLGVKLEALRLGWAGRFQSPGHSSVLSTQGVCRINGLHLKSVLQFSQASRLAPKLSYIHLHLALPFLFLILSHNRRYDAASRCSRDCGQRTADPEH